MKASRFCLRTGAESVYWTFDALSNLAESGNLTDEQKATVAAKVDELQQKAYAAYTELTAADTAEKATELSMTTAAAIHAEAVELVNSLIK